ncbi:hypothetical protein TIFTF001_005609 [Ficus carica]|uniref:Uncharacterized protein n=1 Tax=Ficus carica TaxID=3494 RepID=A0AA88CXS2_FICCA|nr:hypothetical protein TIFTF001_005609 [Ficus carica]
MREMRLAGREVSERQVDLRGENSDAGEFLFVLRENDRNRDENLETTLDDAIGGTLSSLLLPSSPLIVFRFWRSSSKRHR